MRLFVSLVIALVVCSPADLLAKKERTSLRVIVQDGQGNPVPRASVLVRELKGKKFDKIGHTLELRTSQQGTAPLPPMKQGRVLIQVIAKGFQTYGDTVELTELDQTVTITLNPPSEQHSVHTAKAAAKNK